MKKWVIRVAIGAVFLVGAFFVAVSLASTRERPLPSILPGYHRATLEVGHRADPIDLHLWYPAQQGGSGELLAQNALFYGHHILRDAPAQSGSWPVVVVSHGSGGNAPALGWLISDLVRSGMIVVATDHPGTRSRDSDPFQTIKVWERPADMSALLDHLAANPPMGVTPDMTRVAALGFSLGGHSVLSLAGLRVSKSMFIDYCEANAGKIDCGWMQSAGVDFATIDQARYEQSNRDPRIKAVVAVDPALPQAVPDAGTADISTRTLIINLGQPGDVPAAMRADALADRIDGAQYQSIENAWHFSFLAECSALGRVAIGLAGDDNICADLEGRPRSDIHRELRSVIGAFLAETLL
ncbi:hypothetical protein KUH32_08765 [Thalassococcus sp. CAU 1522]|uniref:Dienelactone hydrolase n=1 Tax=Thalassococcus arenae TaxID=2851652 RepID=A0ABS6N792_9RHOB|nr:hypothetical protein [Thalassococcus arenae]MBV2359864.1 hypothetical protein [Thalassococcus arenae]